MMILLVEYYNIKQILNILLSQQKKYPYQLFLVMGQGPDKNFYDPASSLYAGVPVILDEYFVVDSNIRYKHNEKVDII